MFTLALAFCLRAAPHPCLPLRYPGVETVSAMGCLVLGQQTAARMLATEPELQGYALRQVRCEPAGKREEGA